MMSRFTYLARFKARRALVRACEEGRKGAGSACFFRCALLNACALVDEPRPAKVEAYEGHASAGVAREWAWQAG